MFGFIAIAVHQDNRTLHFLPNRLEIPPALRHPAVRVKSIGFFNKAEAAQHRLVITKPDRCHHPGAFGAFLPIARLQQVNVSAAVLNVAQVVLHDVGFHFPKACRIPEQVKRKGLQQWKLPVPQQVHLPLLHDLFQAGHTQCPA